MSNDTSAFQLEEACLNSWFIIITNKQAGKGVFFTLFLKQLLISFFIISKCPFPAA